MHFRLGTTSLVMIIGLVTSGCSGGNKGHDVVFVCDQLPDAIAIEIDFTKGQSPKRVDIGGGRAAYAIQLDANGMASIDCTWLLGTWHRKHFQLPGQRLREWRDFNLDRQPTFRKIKTTVKSNSVYSETLVDGTIFHWTVTPVPSVLVTAPANDQPE